MMVLIAAVVAVAVAIGGYTVLDGSSDPTTRVSSSASQGGAVNQSPVARYANENGLTGLSPTSLGAVGPQAGAISSTKLVQDAIDGALAAHQTGSSGISSTTLVQDAIHEALTAHQTGSTTGTTAVQAIEALADHRTGSLSGTTAVQAIEALSDHRTLPVGDTPQCPRDCR